MTMGSKPTEWNDPESRPVEAGIYHRKSANDHCNDRAFWDGRCWYGVGVKKGQKLRIYESPHPFQDRAWKPVPVRIVEELKAGDRFAMLCFLENVGPDLANRRWLAKFACDCGNIKAMNVYEVRAGRHRSCGCLSGSAEAVEKARAAQRAWIDGNHERIVENNHRVAAINKGKSKPLGSLGKWEFNVHSRYFKIADETGNVLDGWNLADLVRKNEHLFEKDDIAWEAGVCKAVKRLYALYEAKGNAKSWKGWRRVSDSDRESESE